LKAIIKMKSNQSWPINVNKIDETITLFCLDENREVVFIGKLASVEDVPYRS